MTTRRSKPDAAPHHDLPLFAYRKPQPIARFHQHKTDAFVGRVARILIACPTKAIASAFWKRTVASVADDLQRSGLDRGRVHGEIVTLLRDVRARLPIPEMRQRWK